MHILKRIILPSITAGKKKFFALALAGLLLFAVLFLLFLTPLNRAIALKQNAWKKLQSQLIDGQAKLNAAARLDKPTLESELERLRKILPAKSPTSEILDELTKHGKDLGIEFSSITPQPERAVSRAPAAGRLKCRILPIEIKMKATYRSLGEYLGALEHLNSSFATVGGFQARKDERIFPKLDVSLTVYTYMIEEESGQK